MFKSSLINIPKQMQPSLPDAENPFQALTTGAMSCCACSWTALLRRKTMTRVCLARHVPCWSKSWSGRRRVVLALRQPSALHPANTSSCCRRCRQQRQAHRCAY